MEEIQSEHQQILKIKKKYDRISLNMRKQLLRLIEEEGFSVYRASRLLGIKDSTAKAIVRQFRRQGHLFIKKVDVKAEVKGQKKLRISNRVIEIAISPDPVPQISENTNFNLQNYPWEPLNPNYYFQYWNLIMNPSRL